MACHRLCTPPPCTAIQGRPELDAKARRQGFSQRMNVWQEMCTKHVPRREIMVAGSVRRLASSASTDLGRRLPSASLTKNAVCTMKRTSDLVEDDELMSRRIESLEAGVSSRAKLEEEECSCKQLKSRTCRHRSHWQAFGREGARRQFLLLSCSVALTAWQALRSREALAQEDASCQRQQQQQLPVSGPEVYKIATTPITDSFGFDGLGSQQEDYTPGRVVALAQAGDGAVLFVGLDGYDAPMRLLVGAAEAMAVLQAAQGRRAMRPFTHEAWGTTIEAVGWKVQRVAITGMESNMYNSRVVLMPQEEAVASPVVPPGGRGGGSSAAPGFSSRSVEMRPSDAIALALRCRAPLFVARNVAEEASAASIDVGGLTLGPVAPLDIRGLNASVGMSGALGIIKHPQ